jgi:hypothetical protein
MTKDTEPPPWEAGQKTPPKWDFTFARFIIRVGVYLPELNLVIVEIAPLILAPPSIIQSPRYRLIQGSYSSNHHATVPVQK